MAKSKRMKSHQDDVNNEVPASEGILSQPMTRRQAISTVGKAVVGVVVVAAVAGGGYYAYTSLGPSAPSNVKLDFTAWDYGVDTIKDNLNKFMAKFPKDQVTLTDIAYSDYFSGMTQRFSAKTPTDVSYVGEDWLAGWAASNYLVPVQDIWDSYTTNKKFSDYVNDMTPFSKICITYNGKIYGLPYYSDTFNFMYNKKMFSDNNISVPQTWDDVTAAAKKLQGAGIKYPYCQSFQGLSPFDFYQIFSGAMGNGATLLDSSNAPTFNPSAGDPFYDQIQWIVNGIHKDNIINPDYTALTEADIVKKMTGGEVAMTLLAKYNLAAMNAPGSSPAAGNFSLALMPGKTHVAYGFAKMYSMTKMAQDRGHDVTQAAISLIEFFGANDSTVLKRWAVENGLGFGFNSAFSDPDIQTSLVKYYGSDAATLIPQQFKIAQTIPHPVWFGQWVDFANKQALLPALRQDIQVADAVDTMSKKAISLNTP